MSDWDKTVMLFPSRNPARVAEPVRRAAYGVVLTPIAALVLYTVARAIASAFANDDFPESLAIKVELLPIIFPVHMIAGGVALILLPLVIAFRRRPRWHRPLGLITALDILIAGLTAYPVAWLAPVTTVSAAGFSAQATVWLALLALAIHAIRRRQVADHWRYMLLMTATAFGAVFFRIFLALWANFGTARWFDAFYACDSWIAWMLPLGTTALVIRNRTRNR